MFISELNIIIHTCSDDIRRYCDYYRLAHESEKEKAIDGTRFKTLVSQESEPRTLRLKIGFITSEIWQVRTFNLIC